MDNIPSGGARCALARLSTLALLAASCAGLTPSGAAVLGLDDRNEGAAFLTEAQESRSEGLGRIECRGPGPIGTTVQATGWVADAADTVMTAAHTFFRTSREGRRTLAFDPSNCRFVLYNPDLTVRQSARIRYAISPWADPALRGDSSHDFAVLKLERSLRVSHVPAITGSARIDPDVELVAFQTGVLQDRRARITLGETRRFPALLGNDRVEGARITSAARLFSTSADSSPGSSGGLYYDSRTGAVFGLHLGSVCDVTGRRAFYDPDRCFNYGLRLDRRIRAAIAAVVRDEPPYPMLIGPEAPRTTMAMLTVAAGGHPSTPQHVLPAIDREEPSHVL